MDWKFWLPFIITLANLWLMWRADQKHTRYMNPQAVHNALATFPWYKQLWDRYWPIFVMLLLLIGTWIPYFVNTDISDQNVMIFWGTDSPPGVHIPIEQLKNLKVVTDGSRLPPSIRRNYRIAAVADHDIGDIDTDDAELLKSSARDIVDGPISMLIPLTENFRNEYRQGDRGDKFLSVDRA
jgi:hypothetical protein